MKRVRMARCAVPPRSAARPVSARWFAGEDITAETVSKDFSGAIRRETGIKYGVGAASVRSLVQAPGKCFESA